MRVRRVVLRGELLVLIVTKLGDLVEAQAIEQRVVQWLERAYGERNRWQEDGKENASQGSRSDGLEDESDRFPGEPRDGLNDHPGRSWGCGHGLFLRIWSAATFNAMGRDLTGRVRSGPKCRSHFEPLYVHCTTFENTVKFSSRSFLFGKDLEDIFNTICWDDEKLKRVLFEEENPKRLTILCNTHPEMMGLGGSTKAGSNLDKRQ